jgi:shikimate kinase
MKTNIALIGFMGTGKTSVARVLAVKLGKQPVELDELIERRAGKLITRIFQEEGEAAFRKLEMAVVAEAAQGKDQLIACGGGVILNQVNIERLKKDSVIVYLTASPEEILRRVSADGAVRPLLQTEDPSKTVKELLERRRSLYEQAADIVIDTAGLSVEAVAEKVINGLKDYGRKDR